MAFFPRNFYNTASNDGTSFTPLFRLLDDFDTHYNRQSGTKCHAVRRAVPTWQPKFDVRETGEAYELHGELPGMAKENLSIEFAEPQALLIRGKTERIYAAGTPPTGAAQPTPPSSTNSEAGDKSPKPRQATVADEDDDEEFTQVEKADEEPTTVEKPAAVDHSKYWLTERSIGEFSRTFNFPGRVDQDGVTANLTDGILSVTVPKAKKHEPVRVSIN